MRKRGWFLSGDQAFDTARWVFTHPAGSSRAAFSRPNAVKTAQLSQASLI
jgi:hypothetical protein